MISPTQYPHPHPTPTLPTLSLYSLPPASPRSSPPSPLFPPSPPQLQYLNSVILEVLGEEYPDYITPEVGGAWTKLLASIYRHVTCLYEELAVGV